MQPQLSQCEIVPSGALRMLSTSVDGIVRWQPWQVMPTRAAPAPAPLARPGAARSRRRARDRARRRSRRAPCAPPPPRPSISASALSSVDACPARVGDERDAPARRARRASASSGSRASISSSSLVSRFCWCRRSWSMSACIDWSSRGERTRTGVHLRLDFGRLRPERLGFVVEALLLVRELVALRGERTRSRLRARATAASPAAHGLAFGKGLAPMAQTVERAVVLLQRQERLEPGLGGHGVDGSPRGGAGAVVAGGAVAERRRWPARRVVARWAWSAWAHAGASAWRVVAGASRSAR